MDLQKIEKEIDILLETETEESLNNWIKKQTMVKIASEVTHTASLEKQKLIQERAAQINSKL